MCLHDGLWKNTEIEQIIATLCKNVNCMLFSEKNILNYYIWYNSLTCVKTTKIIFTLWKHVVVKNNHIKWKAKE